MSSALLGRGECGGAPGAAASGAVVSGCDAGGPSPYTAALEAAGIAVVTGHDLAHVTDEPRPDQLAVTKALTAIDADHPELRAARDLGIPVEPWQQVVADAAVGRGSSRRGDAREEHDGGMAGPRPGGSRPDPSAFVGALLPPR